MRFEAPIGDITNVEYLYDEDLKRFRIYYREDLPNGEVKIGDFKTDTKISLFRPSVYVEMKHNGSVLENKNINRDLLCDGDFKAKCANAFFAENSVAFPGELSLDEAIAKNNGVWHNYPLLRSIRKKKITPTDNLGIDMDYVNYRPIYQNDFSHSYKQFVADVQKSYILDDDAIANTILPKYQWTAQWIYDRPRNKEVKLRYFHFDIEVEMGQGIQTDYGNNPITMIQICDSVTEKIYVFYMAEKDGKFEKEEGVEYVGCLTEKEMLLGFANLCEKLKPVALAAWFGNGFDYRYIASRTRNIATREPDENFYLKRYVEDGKEKKGDAFVYCALLEKISPYGRVYVKKVTVFGDDIYYFAPLGIYTLDSMDIYKKYSYGERASYKLDAIGVYELGEGKVEYTSMADNLDDLYRDDFDLFMKYAVQDVRLLNALEKKTRYLKIAFNQAYSMGVNVDDVLGTIYPWTHKLYNGCMRLGIAIPNVNRDASSDIEFEGGHTYVNKGKKKKIAAFDVSSLYPKTKESYDISYETVVDVQEYRIYDEMRYLYIKYAMFNDLKQELLGGAMRKELSMGEFTREFYNEYFSLKSITDNYLALGKTGRYQDSMDVFIKTLIENPDSIMLRTLTARLKVAAVVLSPIGCVFQNDQGFNELNTAKLIRAAYSIKNFSKEPNQNEREIAVLRYHLENYIDKISYDYDKYFENLKAIASKIGKDEDKSEVFANRTHGVAESFIIRSAKAKNAMVQDMKLEQVAEALINKRLVENFKGVKLDSKGIMPNMVGGIFKKRKEAKDEAEQYAIAINNIEKVLIERHQKAV